jgi:Na+/H+-dicarboxylate symporter
MKNKNDGEEFWKEHETLQIVIAIILAILIGLFLKYANAHDEHPQGGSPSAAAAMDNG